MVYLQSIIFPPKQIIEFPRTIRKFPKGFHRERDSYEFGTPLGPDWAKLKCKGNPHDTTVDQDTRGLKWKSHVLQVTGAFEMLPKFPKMEPK